LASSAPLSTGAIVGIVLGVIAVISIMTGVSLMWRRYSRHRAYTQLTTINDWTDFDEETEKQGIKLPTIIRRLIRG